MGGFTIVRGPGRRRNPTSHAELEAVDLDPLLVIVLRNFAVDTLIFQVNSHCTSFPRLVNEPWAPPVERLTRIEATPPPRYWPRRLRRFLQHPNGRRRRHSPCRP